MNRHVTIVAMLLLIGLRSAVGADLRDLNEAFQDQKWDAAAQIAHEILRSDPTNATAVMKGAYALFQKGFSNSALVLLKRLTPAQWKSFPQGEDRFAEIVSLFQKKVPLSLLPGRLDQVNENNVPSYLRSEVAYAKGRSAYEKNEPLLAKAYLNQVAQTSRFFTEAQYILATIEVKARNYDQAGAHFSKMFQPAIYQEGSEFWKGDHRG